MTLQPLADGFDLWFGSRVVSEELDDFRPPLNCRRGCARCPIGNARCVAAQDVCGLLLIEAEIQSALQEVIA
jgi:hypothetical protein